MGFSSSCPTGWCQHPCELFRGFLPAVRCISLRAYELLPKEQHSHCFLQWSGAHRVSAAIPAGTRHLLTPWAWGSVELLGSSQQFLPGDCWLCSALGKALLWEQKFNLLLADVLSKLLSTFLLNFSQPPSPVPLPLVWCGFPQVTVPSGAGALLLVSLSSHA